MTAVHLLGVQPDVRAAGKLRCELVVLAVAAADQNFKPVRRHKAQRPLLLGLIGLCALLLFEIAGVRQLTADIGKVTLGLGSI